MNIEEQSQVESIPFEELSWLEQTLAIGGFVVGFVLFAAFFYFFFWRMIRAQLEVPKQLTAIRQALERIANALESEKK